MPTGVYVRPENYSAVMSVAVRNAFKRPEVKRNLIKALSGRKHSKETRLKIAKAHTIPLTERIKNQHTYSVGFKHRILNKRYGKPQKCENKKCSRKSKRFNWALRHGHKYSIDRKDYLRLCQSCHTIYDMNKNWRKKLSIAITKHWKKRKQKLKSK